MGVRRGVWLLLALVAAALLLFPSERVHTTQTEVKRVHRLKDVRGFLEQRTKNALYPVNEPGAWEAVDVVAPNVTDRETLLMLAHMATQAYYKIPAPIPNAPQWKWVRRATHPVLRVWMGARGAARPHLCHGEQPHGGCRAERNQRLVPPWRRYRRARQGQ